MVSFSIYLADVQPRRFNEVTARPRPLVENFRDVFHHDKLTMIPGLERRVHFDDCVGPRLGGADHAVEVRLDHRLRVGADVQDPLFRRTAGLSVVLFQASVRLVSPAVPLAV